MVSTPRRSTLTPPVSTSSSILTLPTTSESVLSRRSSSHLSLVSTTYETSLEESQIPSVTQPRYVPDDGDGIDEYYRQGNDYNNQFLSMYYSNFSTLNEGTSFTQPLSFCVDPYRRNNSKRLTHFDSSSGYESMTNKSDMTQ